MRQSTTLRPWLATLALVAGCDFVFRLDAVKDPVPVDAPPPIIGRWTEVVAGLGHTCALDEDRHIWCWGRNGSGELGISSSVSELDVPRQITADAWTTITSRDATVCGIQDGGSLWCWGANGSGETGSNSGQQPVRVPTLIDAGPWLSVSTFEHTCAIREDHSLWCWGINNAGQLGDGTQTTRPTMAPVSGGNTWDQVSTGSTSTCAVASDKTLWCWGSDGSGQLGQGGTSSTPSLTPVQVGTETWSHVEVGRSYACGINAAGRLRCWGANAKSQLGDGTVAMRGVPAPVLIDDVDRTDWVQIVTGDEHACGRTSDGRTWCWGSAARFQIGLATMTTATTPQPLAADMTLTSLAAGSAHTCAVAADHTLWCVGDDGYGQLGDGGASTTAPGRVPGAWTGVTLGLSHTCAVDAAGGVSCAGQNGGSQLGIPGNDRQELTSLGVTGFDNLDAGNDHTCGIKGGQVWCWGVNGLRQIGTGSTGNAQAPTMIRTGTTVAAFNHTCTIDPVSEHILCWGQNDNGQIGNKPASLPAPAVATPYEIPSLQWRDVKNGRGFTCGVTKANALACWGANANGQLASGNTNDALDPAALAPGFSVDRITVGGFHMCALDTVGAAKCWGADYLGQLGIGVGSGSKTTPQPVPGTWLQLSAGTEYTCGIRDPGTLWCWGENARGQLGIGTRVDANIPTQVGTDDHWSTVSAGDRHTCAVKQVDSSLWCWGDNSEGQLGTGTAWRATPVQVP